MNHRKRGGQGKRLLAGSAAALIAALVGSGATAGEYGAYQGADVLDAAELRAMRGGIRVMGVDFEFGAVHRVTLDGVLVAETVFSMADSGAMHRELTIHDDRVAEFDGSVLDDIDVRALRGLGGVVVSDEKGQSVALTGILPGSIANALINRASDRAVRGSLEVTLAINDFPGLRTLITDGAAAARIGDVTQGNLMNHF